MEVSCEKILVQFVSQGGEASFPPVEVLKDISPSKLLLLLKSFLLDEEERNRSYLFFVNSQEVSVSLAETLKHQLIDYETTLCIVYQPQEVSRVSGLTGRPLASGAGAQCPKPR